MIIPTNEELVVAREVKRFVEKSETQKRQSEHRQSATKKRAAFK
jgi:hypothetical protein